MYFLFRKDEEKQLAVEIRVKEYKDIPVKLSLKNFVI